MQDTKVKKLPKEFKIAFINYSRAMATCIITLDPYMDRFQMAFLKMLKTYHKQNNNGGVVKAKDWWYWYKVAWTAILWDLNKKRDRFILLEPYVSDRYLCIEYEFNVVEECPPMLIKGLQNRLKQVTNLIINGMTIPEIAVMFGVGERSVETYVGLIKRHVVKVRQIKNKLQKRKKVIAKSRVNRYNSI